MRQAVSAANEAPFVSVLLFTCWIFMKSEQKCRARLKYSDVMVMPIVSKMSFHTETYEAWQFVTLPATVK